MNLISSPRVSRISERSLKLFRTVPIEILKVGIDSAGHRHGFREFEVKKKTAVAARGVLCSVDRPGVIGDDLIAALRARVADLRQETPAEEGQSLSGVTDARIGNSKRHRLSDT